MDEAAVITMSLADLVIGVVGSIVMLAFSVALGSFLTMRKQISELHDCHLGPAARDGENKLRWYINDNLVRSMDENTSEINQLSGHVEHLAHVIVDLEKEAHEANSH